MYQIFCTLYKKQIPFQKLSSLAPKCSSLRQSGNRSITYVDKHDFHFTTMTLILSAKERPVLFLTTNTTIQNVQYT